MQLAIAFTKSATLTLIEYTGTGGSQGHDILPSNLMSTSSDDANEKTKTEKPNADGNDTQTYVDQIKQGWSQLSGGVAGPGKDETKTEGSEGQGGSHKSQTEAKDDAKALADDPLGLNVQGDDVRKPKGVRITPGNKKYAEMATTLGKMNTGGAESSADDPLGLGGK